MTRPRSPGHRHSTDLIPRTDLPVEDAIDDLRRCLEHDRAAVLVAPPGAGKTTLVPLRLVDETWLEGTKIVVLEPRRLAARAAARRLAHLLGQVPGELIGFQTRDERVIGPMTRIEIVTEGILTRRIQSDPALEGTGLVIFDEVHERNLPTDLGLALCLDVRASIRPDLRLLAMSATADADTLARLIGREEIAPVIRSHGRAFEVEVIWAPPRLTKGARRTNRLEQSMADTIARAVHDHDGDVLAFLPGVAEIRRVQRLVDLALDHRSDVDIWPLAGSLSLEDQDRALAPSPPGRRRIVLSTDIAETSLTVDGIRIVVDSGEARIPSFDSRTGMSRLMTVATSRASSDQRAGRAGRTEPGVAYRLWSKLEHATRRSHLDAEISHVDLAGFALEIAMWGTPLDALRFIDPPPEATYQRAVQLLTGLGALDATGRVTDLGRRMLTVPVHPRLAKMISASPVEHHSLACLLAVLVDERDFVHGPPDERPVDLLERVEIVSGGFGRGRRQLSFDVRTIERLRHRAQDLARRTGTSLQWDSIDPGAAASLLVLAYPDRVAIRRQPGQFQMVNGSAAWIPRTDPLAEVPFVIAADLDGNRQSARIRLALTIEEHDIIRSAHEVHEERTIVWDKSIADVVEVATIRLGNMKMSEQRRRPPAGHETSSAIFENLRHRRFASVLGDPDAMSIAHRVSFLHAAFGDEWPNWDDATLIATADAWLEPYLAGMTSVQEVASLDIGMLLRSQLPWNSGARLDELAPISWTLPNGRTIPIDYAKAKEEGTAPIIRVRVQDMFGTKTHPVIADQRVRLLLHLLSPADRPIQITADLPGFWTGSWADVRKELAGRYPKHRWPEDPANAEPGRTAGH